MQCVLLKGIGICDEMLQENEESVLVAHVQLMICFDLMCT